MASELERIVGGFRYEQAEESVAFGMSARHVRHVVVGGQVVVRDGRLTGVASSELRRLGHEGAERQDARAGHHPRAS